MKSRCVKMECEECHVLGTAQLFYNNLGVLRYGRIRHYVKLEKGKPIFDYHPQTLEYLNRKLSEVSINDDQIGHNVKINGDQIHLGKSSVNRNEPMVVGLPGFEPGSIEPKSTSLDHASRQPRLGCRDII
jgi:hypothetical protein